MTMVDRALKAFESTTEWADLIAALGKMNKVLKAHMKYPIVPRRILISKRLAQCMHPDLPSGVHLKALETYDLIFKCMGTNRCVPDRLLFASDCLLSMIVLKIAQDRQVACVKSKELTISDSPRSCSCTALGCSPCSATPQ